MTLFLILVAGWAILDIALVVILASVRPLRERREARWASQCAERVIARLHREEVKR